MKPGSTYKIRVNKPPSALLALVLIASLVLASFWLTLSSLPTVLAASYTTTGTVYRDYNANGVQDTLEPGVPGVTVTAYDASGAVVGTAISAANGSYSIPVPSGNPVRIEFTNYPTFLKSGPHGTAGSGLNSSDTSIGFASAASSTVNFGVNAPSQYCQNNPDLATSCYQSGSPVTNTNATVVRFPYTASGTGTAPTGIGTDAQVGTTWGLAYQRSSNNLFAGAFLKRYTGFGPGGTGAIYRIPNANTTPGTPSVFLDLNSLFPGAGGVDPHPTATANFKTDDASFPLIGKIGLGGLALDEDSAVQTLYTVGLNDQKLYKIPIGNPPVAPAPGAIGSFPVPASPPNCTGVATDVRPFAVTVYDGLVYVGMICSAESTVTAAKPQGDPTKLWGYVYSFNPLTNSFGGTPFAFPLNYPHGCANRADVTNPPCNGYVGTWNPWINTFAIPPIHKAANDTAIVYSQPLLTDLQFDNGNMIIGLRDRFGDQTGYNKVINGQFYSGITAGDILRACGSPTAGWTLEANGSCGGITSAGAGDNQGPAGGEYYYQDAFVGGNAPHQELAEGGLAQVPGQPAVNLTAFDPVNVFNTGGTLRFNNSDGTRSNAYDIYPANAPNTFGKANGLGDLVALCNAAPLEIGNRVWIDPDKNGIQDPGEVNVPGVTVHLYASDGVTLLGTTTTDANGLYYFTVAPNTGYVIKLDNPADYTTGPLQGYTATVPLQGTRTTIDSNGVLANPASPIGPGNFPTTSLTTGGPGANDHTYDFGFYLQQPVITPTPTSTPTPTIPPTTPPSTTGNTPTATATPTPTATPSTPSTPAGTVTPTPTPSTPGSPPPGQGTPPPPGQATPPPPGVGTPPPGPPGEPVSTPIAGGPTITPTPAVTLPNTGRAPVPPDPVENGFAMLIRWLASGMLFLLGGGLVYRGWRNRAGRGNHRTRL